MQRQPTITTKTGRRAAKRGKQPEKQAHEPEQKCVNKRMCRELTGGWFAVLNINVMSDIAQNIVNI
jgi:hypothetical protein